MPLASTITFRPLCYQGSYQVTSSSLLVGIGTRCTPSNHIPNSSPTRALEVTEQATNQALHRCDKLCLYRTSPIVDRGQSNQLHLRSSMAFNRLTIFPWTLVSYLSKLPFRDHTLQSSVILPNIIIEFDSKPRDCKYNE